MQARTAATKLQKPFRTDNGFNLVQVMMSVTVMGILAAIAVPSISFGANPLTDTTTRLTSHFKLARTKAMSTTTAIRLKPLNNNSIEIQQHSSDAGTSRATCQDANTDIDGNGKPVWQRVAGYNTEDFQFEDGIVLNQAWVNGASSNITNWSLCFDSRGLSSNTLTLELKQSQNSETTTLNVLMGGSVNIQ